MKKEKTASKPSGSTKAATQKTAGSENIQDFDPAALGPACPVGVIPRFIPNRGCLPYKLRQCIAKIAGDRPQAINPNNGEEGVYPTFPFQANYSKALRKDLASGRSDPDPVAYRQYMTILDEARQGFSSRFEQIELGGVQAQPCNCTGPLRLRKQTNPQAGLAADLQGTDLHATNSLNLFYSPAEGIRPAPRIDALAASPRTNVHENAAEMVEVYWMSLLRDVHFNTWAGGGVLVPPAGWPAASVAMAAQDINVIKQYFAEPYPTQGGSVTVNTVFRGSAFGDDFGPYISQFLYRGNTVTSSCCPNDPIFVPEDGVIPQGTFPISQRQATIQPFVDYMRNVCEWRCVEQGSVDPSFTDQLECKTECDCECSETLEYIYRGRFIRNLRDLANAVHNDTTIQHFRNAALIMINENPLVRPFRFDPGLPYEGGQPDFVNQVGFITFGPLHPLTLIQEAAIRALRAAWFHKWYVHRRLRPEEFAGLVHYNLTSPIDPGPYPCVDRAILTENFDGTPLPNGVLARIFQRNQVTDAGCVPVPGEPGGSYLLPQVYPEGSPTHPAYPSGHATSAGACATILKALFDESVVMTNVPGMPRVLIASTDGCALDDAPEDQQVQLTVEGELNKLASNVAIGRNAAGVHWRSDATQGMELGEAVAAKLLVDQAFIFHESFSLSFRRFFRNERIRISKPDPGIGKSVLLEVIDEGSKVAKVIFSQQFNFKDCCGTGVSGCC